MEKIPSFTINHLTLKPGVYLSRVDTTDSGDTLSTFDCRMTAPNREAAISPQALHAMEHLAATFLRNDPEWKERIIYWGPMGCCTGNYLIVKGRPEPQGIGALLRRCMAFIAGFEGDIPGASARDCGNYLFMHLPEAKMAATRYLEVLADPACSTEYPE